MKKTLGGDRLGSGSKMQVELHNYERSTHDLSYIWRSTMAAGPLVPFLSELGLPGDTFDIHLNCDIKTHPTVGPLFGSYKVQLDVFTAPIRLYQAQLHNNKLGIGMKMSSIYLPQYSLTATEVTPDTVPDYDNSQVNPSSIISYLGVRGVGKGVGIPQTRDFNGIPLLAYWDIYKNYYANKQEEIGAVIHTTVPALGTTPTSVQGVFQTGNTPVTIQPQGTAGVSVHIDNGGSFILNFTGTAPAATNVMLNLWDGRRLSVAELTSSFTGDATHVYGQFNFAKFGPIVVLSWQMRTPYEVINAQPIIKTFPLDDIDKMRDKILQYTTPSSPFVISNQTLEPYQTLFGSTTMGAGTYYNIMSTQEGLGIKTYQSDLFNNWLQTDWIDGVDGISAITAIDTTSGSFSIDTLVLSRKVYDMLNRIAVSGGTYDDWLDAVYTHERYQRCTTPMYNGGLIKELIFQEVVSQTQSSQGQPLGTLAGKGAMSQKHKGGNVVIKVDEPCYIIGIISLTPRLDYSQGNKWDTHLQTMDELHKPALDEIGFQELLVEQMAWWSTIWNGSGWDTPSAGKQPAWLNYMTNVNQTRGNFAIKTNEMFMTLNRRYTPDDTTGQIKDLTTYIDPAKFNYIFAQTSLDSQNFWAQIAVDITARRKMSAKVMPNL